MSDLVRSFRNDIRQLAAIHAARPAFIDARNNVTLSFGDLIGLLGRCEKLFRTQSADTGATILSMLPNSAENLLLFFGAAFSGAGYTPLPVDSSVREVDQWIALTKPTHVIISAATADEMVAHLKTLNIPVTTVELDSRFEWLPPEGPGEGAGHEVRAGRLYLSTSGSTGEPRAIVFDTDRLWSSGRAFSLHHGFLDHNARFLNIMPMSYLGGLFNLGFIPLCVGGSTVITEQFSGRTFMNFWQMVERFEVNVLWLVPTMVRGLLVISERTRRHEIMKQGTGVKVCLLGTAPIDLATKLKFEQVFDIPLLENFALSETTFFSTETLNTQSRRVEGSVGQILPYAKLQFVGVGSGDDGAAAGDAPAQLCVQSPFLFLGYLGKDGSITLPLNEDGYFATGDLGHMEEPDLLVVNGRTRDIIKKGGYMVSLREIEIIAEEHDAVEEAAAVPVAHEFYGENFTLCLKLADGADESAVPGVERWLHERLVRYKWPGHVQSVSDFPRTPSGKIRKHVLRTQLASESSPQQSSEGRP